MSNVLQSAGGLPTYPHHLHDSELLHSPEVNLPAYTSQSEAASTQPAVRTRYAERLQPKEFSYSIKSRGKEIVVLILNANARHSLDAPTFVGTDPIAGTVRLQLDKSTVIKSATLTISGRCLPTVGFYVDYNSFSDETTFMEISHQLWPSEDTSSHAPGERLQGEYLWPFSIDVPALLAAPTATGEVLFVPPQTFKEQYCAMVVYDIQLRVKRSWSSPDLRIEAPFKYIPAIRPSALPLLRTLAYESRVSLPDPSADPNGWYASNNVRVTGTLFKSLPFAVECTLFLARPLEYTRGTEIPLYMRMVSSNKQAIDVISAAAATVINVRLQRRITLSAKDKGRKLLPGVLESGNRVEERGMGKAIWWPSPSTDVPLPSGEELSIYIRGELHLKGALKPSSAMPYMKIEYRVLTRPFLSTTGIDFDIQNENSSHKQAVEIATLYAQGPVPQRHIPPT